MWANNLFTWLIGQHCRTNRVTDVLWYFVRVWSVLVGCKPLAACRLIPVNRPKWLWPVSCKICLINSCICFIFSKKIVSWRTWGYPGSDNVRLIVDREPCLKKARWFLPTQSYCQGPNENTFDNTDNTGNTSLIVGRRINNRTPITAGNRAFKGGAPMKY